MSPSSTALALTDQAIQAIADKTGFEGWQIDTVIRNLAPQMTAPDAWLFFTKAQYCGLSPFSNPPQILPVYFGSGDEGEGGNKMAVVTTIDGFRSIAHRPKTQPPFGGITLPQYCGPDGKWSEYWDENSMPVACKIGGWYWGEPESITWVMVKFSEYARRRKDGKLMKMWANMPCNMLSKCAEGKLYKTMWPAQFEGLTLKETVPEEGDAEVEHARQMNKWEKRSLPAPQPAEPRRASTAPTPIGDFKRTPVGKVIEGTAEVVEPAPSKPEPKPQRNLAELGAALGAERTELLKKLVSQYVPAEPLPWQDDGKARAKHMKESFDRLKLFEFTEPERYALGQLLHFATTGELTEADKAYGKINAAWFVAFQTMGNPEIETLHEAARWFLAWQKEG